MSLLQLIKRVKNYTMSIIYYQIGFENKKWYAYVTEMSMYKHKI